MSGISPGMRVVVPSGQRSDKGSPVRGTVLHDNFGPDGDVPRLGTREWWIKLDEKQDFGDHGWYTEDEIEAIIGMEDQP